MADTPQVVAESQARLFAEFLESSPPDVQASISDLAEVRTNRNDIFYPSGSDIQLHCPSERCGGTRFFKRSGDAPWIDTDWKFLFVTYVCRNCGKTTKNYAVMVRCESNKKSGFAQKLGEVPAYGPPVPARVITLIGPDREVFLRGRRSENNGLGIGAFAYYRRVVEKQKGRIIGEMGRVAQRVGASKEVAALFAAAAQETQFSKAIETIKTAIPESLLINGHNPLTLLHSALSEGIHEHTDEECLELATSIRVILTELAERMSQVLKDDAELKEAVTRLLNRSQQVKGVDAGAIVGPPKPNNSI